MQSVFKNLVFASILHKFSIKFKAGEFPSQSKTLMRFSSKIFSLFCSMARRQVLLKNFSSVGKCPFHVFYNFTLNYFNIFVGIHNSLNREKRSDTFKAISWYKDSRFPTEEEFFSKAWLLAILQKKMKKKF